ncbi:MAG: O-succinylhomoserine sulfhydrylase [Alphaproteobacteria bacterium]|nr:O-succinylhomoserine sulfhydrylase [Alphaproteobacteria bacterium]
MKNRAGTDRSLTSKWARQTQMVRAGSMRSDFGEMSEAMFMTSAFTYPTAEEAEARFDGRAEGFTYSRQTNPTVAMFEERMALLEGADVGRATGTGMAAMTASLMASLKAGDHVLAARALFGSCRWLLDNYLPRFGIETTVVDGTDLEAWKANVRPNTKILFTETPANPTLEIVDIRALADLAHENGALLVVDNVFATPVLQRPMKLGADIVAYSTTKHIDGQGRCLGGIVLCSKEFDDEHLYAYYRHTGCAMSPFNAWVNLKGLETLSLRVNGMCDNAEQLAKAVADRVADTRHPCLPTFKQQKLASAQMERGGTMVVFELPGGRDQAFTFMNSLEIADISNNLGDSRSIATHPWSTTHKALPEEDRLEVGVTPGLIRFSVGLECGDDLVQDVMQALDKAGV